MKLSELLKQSKISNDLLSLNFSKNLDDVEISDLSIDSRKISKNSAFFALHGIKRNGIEFAFDAAKKGAKAIFISGSEKFSSNEFIKLFPNTALVLTTSQEFSFALLVDLLNQFYSPKPARIYAITGTNGKTSVAEFTRQILELLGKKSASIGTLGLNCNHLPVDSSADSSLTTPDIVSLHKTLHFLKQNEVDDVVLEVSSIGLHQNRVAGLSFAVGGFTNFTQDHLDYHGNMESYFAAKKLLFERFLSNDSVAVLNADIPEFEELKSICKERKIRVVDFGYKAKILRINSMVSEALNFDFDGQNFSFKMPVNIDFQAYNLLAAIGNVISTNDLKSQDIATLLPKLSTLKSAVGRMQQIAQLPNGAKVFIDFAHTPDALKNVLQACLQFSGSRIITLFGCGGDRDASKRPLMGKIASDLSDFVIITDDNPRSEDPAKIRCEIFQACESEKAIEIPNRETAIEHAISMLKNDDILILAGKGHERYQIIGEKKLPFDEAQIVNRAISKITASSGIISNFFKNAT